MSATQHRQRFDRSDWSILARAVLGVATSTIPIAIIPLGGFLKPLQSAFGWGRGDVSLAITAIALSMALAMPLAGRFIDRFGIVRPAFVSVCCFAAGLLALPWSITHGGLPGFYLCAIWIGAAGSACNSVAYVKILSARFDRSRGLALGIAMCGMSLGGAVAPGIAVVLIDRYGWAAGFYGLAALPIFIAAPIILSFAGSGRAVRPTATPPGQSDPSGMTWREAARTRGYWSMFLLFLAAALALHGLEIHLQPLLSDRGLSPEASVAALSALFLVSLIARICCGFLFDRMFAPYIGALCFCASAIGAAMLALPIPSSFQATVAIILIGVGTGSESDLLALLVSRYYGPRAFGQIYGSIFAAFMVGSAAGPYLVGALFDRFGSYGVALAWTAAALVLAAALLAVLPRFPRAPGPSPSH